MQTLGIQYRIDSEHIGIGDLGEELDHPVGMLCEHRANPELLRFVADDRLGVLLLNGVALRTVRHTKIAAQIPKPGNALAVGCQLINVFLDVFEKPPVW